MLKRTVVAVLVGMLAGFGVPYGLHKYQAARQVRLEAAAHQAALQRLVEGQRAVAQNLQEVTAGGGRASIMRMVPPQSSVGIAFHVTIKEEDEKRSIAAIEVLDVWRDSAAGRAGVEPGDWVVSIGETALCNLMFTPEERKTRDIPGDAEKQMSTASRLFAEAGDSYTLTVERDGAEKQFQLKRGPTAPELAKFVAERLEGWDAYLKGLNAEASALNEEMAKPVATWDDFEARQQRINALWAKVNVPWDEIDAFYIANNVTVLRKQ